MQLVDEELERVKTILLISTNARDLIRHRAIANQRALIHFTTQSLRMTRRVIQVVEVVTDLQLE